MLRWSRSIVAALCIPAALTWSPLTSEAQEAVPLEFTVVGYGPIATIEHNCPIDDQGKLTRYVPITIVCKVRALDAEGLFTPANFVATLSGPADRVAVEVVDTLMTIRILRTTGIQGVSVKLEAFPVLLVAAVYLQRPIPYVQVDTIMPISVVEGESFQLCAYVGGYGNATAKGVSPSGYNCPDFGGVPLPVFPVQWRPGEGAQPMEVLAFPRPAVLARR